MELTIEEALKKGVASHQAGKLDEAGRIYRTILEIAPDHPDANHNLGVLTSVVDGIAAAIPLFRTALKANPSVAQFWVSYINALIESGDIQLAKEVLTEAAGVGLSEGDVNKLAVRMVPQSNTGLPQQKDIDNLILCYQQGQFTKAEELARRIIHQFPENQFAWKVLGALLGQIGRSREAAEANQIAVRLDPQDANAHSNLGNSLKELGRHREAEKSYRQAIDLMPDLAEAHNNLGVTLKKLGKLEEAEASYRKALAINSEYPEACNNLGITLQELGRMEEAEEAYSQAIKLKPDYAESYSNLANIQKSQGRFDEAETNYRHAIELKPDFAEAYRFLALIKKFEDTDDDLLLNIQALHENRRYSEEQRCHLCFALGKAFEDLGRFKEAIHYYHEANVLRKKQLKYDIRQDKELFDQLKSGYAQLQKYAFDCGVDSEMPTPIFIIGMPRSGTTLIEQIVTSHSKVSGAGELPFVAQFGASIARGLAKADTDAIAEFRRRYFDKLKGFYKGAEMVTDKMPHNFLYLGLIVSAFPEAKIVHVSRSPAAVCWGNYKQYFETESIGYCYNLSDIVEYYSLYRSLMLYWGKRFERKIYHLDYERLTLDQEGETRKLIHYLGLDWEQSCLSPQTNSRAVATASNVQIRQKIYQGSSQSWRRFQPFLEGIFDHLDDVDTN